MQVQSTVCCLDAVVIREMKTISALQNIWKKQLEEVGSM